MSQTVSGGFEEAVVESEVASDVFLEGEVSEVVVSSKVQYYSGSLGGPKHIGATDVVQRRKERNNTDIRIVGVAPEVYVRVSVLTVGETCLLSMPISKIVSLGDFNSSNGSFVLSDKRYEMKYDSSSVTINGVGTFNRVDEPTNSIRLSGSSGRRSVFNRDEDCRKEIQSRLRKEWAKQNDVYSFVAEVSYDDPEYSSSATLSVEVPYDFEYENISTLEFRVSSEDWDENAPLRNLVSDTGHGIPSNLDGEKVRVSLAEHSDSIASDGVWHLYEHTPTNTVKTFWQRFLSMF